MRLISPNAKNVNTIATMPVIGARGGIKDNTLDMATKWIFFPNS